MKANMGTADRWIRLILGAVLLYLYFASVVTGTAGWVVLAVGAIFILTSLVKFCPLYTLFGWNTCSR